MPSRLMPDNPPGPLPRTRRGFSRERLVASGLLLLWLVLVNYRDAVVGALIASFVVTLLIFAMAVFVRDH